MGMPLSLLSGLLRGDTDLVSVPQTLTAARSLTVRYVVGVRTALGSEPAETNTDPDST